MLKLTPPDPDFYIFGDGASSQKQDAGAWCGLIMRAEDRAIKILMGSEYPTTISRMELMPIISSVRWLTRYWKGYHVCPTVRIYSDSEYTIKTISGVYPRKKNLELWVAVDEALKGINPDFVWRQRNTLPQTVLVDTVCTVLRKRLKNYIIECFDDFKEPEKSIGSLSLPDQEEMND